MTKNIRAILTLIFYEGDIYTSYLFAFRPNSDCMKRTWHYLMNALPSNLKTVKNVDIFKKKYSEYLLLQQKHN